MQGICLLPDFLALDLRKILGGIELVGVYNVETFLQLTMREDCTGSVFWACESSMPSHRRDI